MCCANFFYCKQKTAYEMRISDWSSDVCSSDLGPPEYSSTTELLRQHLCYFGHADVERDMIVQQTGMNGKVYVGGHMVGCMVAHDQDAAAVQLANDRPEESRVG